MIAKCYDPPMAMPNSFRTARSSEALRAVELLLLWEGAVRNERLREVLDVHFTTASRAMSDYVALNPAGVRYDTSSRRYVADAGFKAALTAGEVEEYLAFLRRAGPSGEGPIVRTHVGLAAPSSATFAVLQRAIREGRGVDAHHRSLRHPEPSRKTCFPHALIEAGRRWHVRAYVPTANAFQDLALSRITSATLAEARRPPEAEPAADEAWMTPVEVRLQAHTALSADQQTVVRAEYFQGALARTLTVRGALVPYLPRDLDVAIDEALQRPPEYLLSVANIATVKRWLLPGWAAAAS